jgi:RNase adaptor protein for sRNA GlmZ degradation
MTKPHIILTSFGLKNQPKTTNGEIVFPKADFYVDCRIMPDAVNKVGIAGTGDDPAIQKWLEEQAPGRLNNIMEQVLYAIEMIPIRRKEMKDPWSRPMRIAFFCAFGIHRSRGTKNIIAKRLKPNSYSVEIESIVTKGGWK